MAFDLNADCLLATAARAGPTGGVYDVARRLNPQMAKELDRRLQSVAHSVGLIQVGTAGGGHTGSCVLLTPHLLLTCLHVLRDLRDVSNATVTFFLTQCDAVTGRTETVATSARLLPHLLFLTSAEEDARRRRVGEEPLDFALIAAFLPPTTGVQPGLESRLAPTSWQSSQRIQWVQVAGIHAQRRVVEMYPPGEMREIGKGTQGQWGYPIHYIADTEASYSGGAVLTLAADVIALHQGTTAGVDNFGVPIHAALHCAATVWEQQQRERGQPQGVLVQGRGAAQVGFLRLLKTQGIAVPLVSTHRES